MAPSQTAGQGSGEFRVRPHLGNFGLGDSGTMVNVWLEGVPEGFWAWGKRLGLWDRARHI